MLKNDEYFKRYGAYVSEGLKSESAWYETERDLYSIYGFRRFRTFPAFKDAHCRYRSGSKPKRIILHTVEELCIK